MSDYQYLANPQTPLEAIGQALGAVSMSWNPPPTGVFDSTQAGEIVDELLRFLRVSWARQAALLDAMKVARVRCPHTVGLCFVLPDGELANLPCPCNDRSEIEEIWLLQEKMPQEGLDAIERWLDA